MKRVAVRAFVSNADAFRRRGTRRCRISGWVTCGAGAQTAPQTGHRGQSPRQRLQCEFGFLHQLALMRAAAATRPTAMQICLDWFSAAETFLPGSILVAPWPTSLTATSTPSISAAAPISGALGFPRSVEASAIRSSYAGKEEVHTLPILTGVAHSEILGRPKSTVFRRWKRDASRRFTRGSRSCCGER